MTILKNALNFQVEKSFKTECYATEAKLYKNYQYYEAILHKCCGAIGVDPNTISYIQYGDAITKIINYVVCFDQELYDYKVETFMIWIDEDYTPKTINKY